MRVCPVPLLGELSSTVGTIRAATLTVCDRSPCHCDSGKKGIVSDRWFLS